MSKPVCAIIGVGPQNGTSFARRFDSAGYRIALLSRSTTTTGDLVGELADAKAYACDAADPVSIRAAFSDVQRDFGRVDAGERIDPDDLVALVHFVTSQPRSAWSFEIDARPARESW